MSGANLEVSLIVRALDGERSSSAIAEAVEELIRNGSLAAGQKLPTVRNLAAGLSVSPATVSLAWTRLVRAGLLQTGRRRGASVRAVVPDQARAGARYALDQVVPDPYLLPDIGAALSAAAAVIPGDASDEVSIEPALRTAAQAGWPYRAAAFTVANGPCEAALLALRATVRCGGAVAVAEPGDPRLLDIVRSVPAEPMPFRCDRSGPDPAALRRVLLRRPDVVIFQPRAQVPTGASLTPRRRAELAAVLDAGPAPVVVIEDDSIGPAGSALALSLGGLHSGRHLLIRSYCKAYGVDIRTSVISGPAEVIARIEQLHNLGVVGTNRILQVALANLLGDEATDRAVRAAQRRYRERRASLAAALIDLGVPVDPAGDGLTLWVPVADETAALEQLRTAGIAAGSGAACHVTAQPEPHLWFCTATLPDAPERVAALARSIAAAAVCDDYLHVHGTGAVRG